MSCRRFLQLLVLLSFSASSLDSAQGQDKVLRAEPRGEEKIVIDGVLAESAWRRAQVASDFVGRAPTPGEVSPIQPRIRVVYGPEALYFAIEVPSRRKPQVFTLQRDDWAVFEDDALSIKLDVNRDRRTTLGFTINAANAQLDYIATDNGRTFRREFDNVWESATTIGGSSWTAEFRIPAEALGLRPGQGAVEMGLNVTYEDRELRGIYDWAPLKPELGATYAPDYGRLTGIDSFDRGTPLVLLPYALVELPGETAAGVELPVRARVGGEARVRMLSDTWAELSLLTDFSQVDLDDAVLNLNRFPLFFPERRPFFLSGLDVFDFGASFNGATTTVFFTRRVGLDDSAQPVPLWGGLKVYGREGAFRFGLLDAVSTRNETNHGVARARVDLGESYVGAIFAARNELRPGTDVDPTEDNYAVGLDSEVRAVDGHLRVRGTWSAASDEALRLSDHMSATANILWAGRVFSPQVDLLYVQDAFNPSMGFVRRTDFASAVAILPVQIRNPSEEVRELTFQADATYEVDAEFQERLGYWLGGRVASDFHNIALDLRAYAMEDQVREAFELFPGVMIEPGAYKGLWTRFTLSNPAAHNPTVSLSYAAHDGFFGGTNHTLAGALTVNAGRHARLSSSVTQSFSKLPGYELVDSTTVNFGATIAFSTLVATDFAFRINTQTEQTAALAKVRYRYTTGSDLFLVYRHDIGFDGQVRASLTLKLSYRFDTLL